MDDYPQILAPNPALAERGEVPAATGWPVPAGAHWRDDGRPAEARTDGCSPASPAGGELRCDHECDGGIAMAMPLRIGGRAPEAVLQARELVATLEAALRIARDLLAAAEATGGARTELGREHCLYRMAAPVSSLWSFCASSR